jgi:hypothetical protein
MCKSFSHPNDGCNQQLEQERLNLCMRNIDVLIMCEAIKYKTRELAKSHNVVSFQDQHGLVCMYVVEEWVLSF